MQAGGGDSLLSPVTEGGDEVETAVHAVVLDVLAVQATLVAEVLLKLLVYVVGHGLPAEGGTHRDKPALRKQQCISCDPKLPGSRTTHFPLKSFLIYSKATIELKINKVE